MHRWAILALLVVCATAVPRSLQRRPRLNGRIVGGANANIEDYPYQVSLEYEEQHRCGASIINVDWILTSAHCVDGGFLDNIQIRVGSSKRGEGGTLYAVSDIIVHDNYNDETFDNDIALLKMNASIPLGTGVDIISLADAEPAVGEEATVTGWGTTQSAGSLSSQLQMVKVPIVDRQKCNTAYGSITLNMICAGVDAGGKDACQGDSGGPLVVGGKLAGIVSWGYGCGEAQYPGVYTNVVVFHSFITETTGLTL